jgi:hypothetical protein
MIFRVSQLKKCLKAPMDAVLPDMAPLEADLMYPEHPIKILDRKDRVTWRKTIKFFKVQWITTPKRKPLGRVKMSSVCAIRISFCRSRVCATVRCSS